MDNIHNMDFVMDELNKAKLAVERAQEDQTGFAEAQQQLKRAEESLNTLKPSQVDSIRLQKATDLLRLIEETNNAIKQ